MTKEAAAAWVRREIERRAAEEAPERAVEPPDPANLPARGGWIRGHPDIESRARRNADEPSRAIEAIICGACSGWRTKPDARGFEKAIKARARTAEAERYAWTLLGEATLCEIFIGEREDAWSLADIAWWMHELDEKDPVLSNVLISMSMEWTAERGPDNERT